MAPLKTVTPVESPIVQAIYNACADQKNKEARRGYLGMSSIGRPCARELWLNFKGARGSLIDGRTARIFANGHAVEDRVIADLRLAGYEIDGAQTAFSDFDGKFKGHCDGIIYGITKQPHILEIKSANKASFEKFQAKGIKAKPEYFAQVQCYMGYAGLERALFVVECKDNQALYVERVYFSQIDFAALKNRAHKIITAIEAPPKNESACWFCNFKYVCDNPILPKQPQNDCTNCRHFRAQEYSGYALKTNIESLKTNIEYFKNRPHLSLAKKDLDDFIVALMNQRPDLEIPTELLRRPYEKVEDYLMAILYHHAEHALVEPQEDDGQIVTIVSANIDLLTARWSCHPASGHWCNHPGHRAKIFQTSGCPDREDQD